jgi:hypothetical protein
MPTRGRSARKPQCKRRTLAHARTAALCRNSLSRERCSKQSWRFMSAHCPLRQTFNLRSDQTDLFFDKPSFRKRDYHSNYMLTFWTLIRSRIVACPVGKNADEHHPRRASSTKGTIKNRKGNFSLRRHLTLPTKQARGSLTNNGSRYRDFARNGHGSAESAIIPTLN